MCKENVRTSWTIRRGRRTPRLDPIKHNIIFVLTGTERMKRMFFLFYR
jgi:hypothetical protein